MGGSSIELQVKILTPLALPVSKEEEEEEEEKLKKEKEREEEELGYDERIFTVQVRLGNEHTCIIIIEY